MLLSQLPQEIQDKLIAERKELHAQGCNTAYHVRFVNKEGTRFFEAYRFNDFDGHKSTGGYWKIDYGKIVWMKRVHHIGWGFPDDVKYSWVNGQLFGKSANGTEIPKTVGSKKEVMAIAKAIGIFEI